MRVLALLTDRAVPPITGVRVRNHALWPAVQRLGVEVRCLAVDLQPGDGAPQGPPGVATEFFRYRRRPLPARAAGTLLHTYHEWPRSAELAGRVDQVVRDWRPDVIHAEELRSAFYLPRLRGRPAAAAQTVTLHNVESELTAQNDSVPVRLGASALRRLRLRNLRAYERRAVARADLAFAYSERDAAVYRLLYPEARWAVTRNGTDARAIAPPPQAAAPDVLLLGSLSYAPNVRGLNWFLDEVRPRLPPGVRVTVAGSRAWPEVRERLAALAGSGVAFVDTPPELAPLYAAASVAAVPLFEGSGTRGRILEALAYERVVVTTTKGAEGIPFGEAEGVLVADDAEAFARRVAGALADPAARGEAARRGREAVIAHYDWSVVAAELVEGWSSCVSR